MHYFNHTRLEIFARNKRLVLEKLGMPTMKITKTRKVCTKGSVLLSTQEEKVPGVMGVNEVGIDIAWSGICIMAPPGLNQEHHKYTSTVWRK
jgi:hypothetical protein